MTTNRKKRNPFSFFRSPFLLFLTSALLNFFTSYLLLAAVESRPVKHYTVHIIRKLPHSTQSFTEGLVYHDEVLYESTGLYDQSSLQKVDAVTGTVQKFLLVPNVFAEGLARWEDRLIQLTWKNKTAFIYSLADFSLIGMFQYDTEGWGLTADEHHLIMSNGTDVLFFRDPNSFAIERVISVTLDGKPVYYLNELEYVEGLIYANVWYQDFIVQIDPEQGEIVGVIDASPLLQMLPPLGRENVLNGIAYNAETKTFYLTGKNWPVIFEGTLVQESERF